LCITVQVETFVMHESFTSKGGFRIAINGVVFLRVPPPPSPADPAQVHGQLEESWDQQQLAWQMLRRFQEYANQVTRKTIFDFNAASLED
jgi:hypothetical protein